MYTGLYFVAGRLEVDYNCLIFFSIHYNIELLIFYFKDFANTFVILL